MIWPLVPMQNTPQKNLRKNVCFPMQSFFEKSSPNKMLSPRYKVLAPFSEILNISPHLLNAAI